MSILVTGCAGYIGAITVKILLEQGYDVVGIDDLSTGIEANIPKEVTFYKSCISDTEQVTKILNDHKIDAVMHFAGFIVVSESVQNPAKYFDNILISGIKFLNLLLEHKVKNFVYSSTAAVYGTPESVPITESQELDPINPYGEAKLALEKVLQHYSLVHDFNYVALRYFNVCGAYGELGECHEPETHLIPLVLDAVLGKREDIKIFGTNYPTADSTAVRDYIHVRDLAAAHISALEAMVAVEKSQPEDFQEKLAKVNQAYNLGYGHGYSVRQVIEKAKEISGKDFVVVEADPRDGDPAELVADSSKIKKSLGWSPAFDDLGVIIKDAYEHRVKYHKMDLTKA